MKPNATLSILVAVFFASPVLAGPAYKIRTEFPTVNGGVSAVAVDEENDIVYIAGSFTEVGGEARSGLAALNTDSGALLPWNPGTNGPVYDVALDDGILYVGGLFSEIAGETRNNAAAVDADGTLLPWNPNTNGAVNTIATNTLSVYLGGGFTMVNWIARSKFANVLKSNGSPLPFWTFSSNSGEAFCLNVLGSSIYLGGWFLEIDGTSRPYLAAVSDTGNLLPWNPGANGSVMQQEIDGSTIYLGGAFTQIGGGNRYCLAALDTATGSLLPWDPQPDNSVRTIKKHGDRIYVGGFFASMGGQSRGRVAAIDLAGNVLPWNPVTDGSVADLAVSGGTVYLGGDFETVDGIARQGFAAIYDPALLPKPEVSVKGRRILKTSRSSIVLRGTSKQATGVELKIGSAGYKPVEGIANWSRRARLKLGRNLLLARSVNVAGATSTPVRRVVYRR
jgi:hypothetical protein